MEFTNIWQKEEHYPAVIDLWHSSGILPKGVKAEDRAKELVYMVKENDKVIGVTTAVKAKIAHLNDNYFFTYRMFVHPDHRRPGLSSKLIVITRDFLENLFLEKKSDCIGLIVITDKPEYITTRNEAVWRASKLTFIGTLTNGRHMRVYYFKGARI